MSELSLELGRQLGLLLDRSGSVASVVVGDGHGLFLPEMGRERGGLTRLKGLRLIHTHLSGEGLTQDDLNDLAMLRLDMVAALLIDENGLPRKIDAAHLLPDNASGQTLARLSAPSVNSLELNFFAFIHSLEEELARTQRAVSDTETGDRALLISVTSSSRISAEERLDELKDLARSAGLQVIDRVLLRRRQGKKAHILSQDRLRDLTIRALQLGVDLFVFDQDLSPAEINRLTDQTELRIIDRTQLILDIFAQSARTREGRIQVELAQLNYLLPRLITKNTALSRLTGGIGGRGPGETKLEINRRRARERIAKLRRDLNQIKAQRGRRRERRFKEGLPIVSIVGYTNAGKSTLLNNLTRSDVVAEDRLFATLDPTTRRLKFPRDRSIIITDTVGFIRDLPQDLLEAFAATLEELASADLLLHVIDISSPGYPEQIQNVERLLDQLDLSKIPVLPVLNKIDLVDPDLVPKLAGRYQAIPVSAQDPRTFSPLIDELSRRFSF